MIEQGCAKTSLNNPSGPDGAGAHIVSDERQQAAYDIQKQLEELLVIANKNQMEMLSYLIEMALLEATGRAKRSDF